MVKVGDKIVLVPTNDGKTIAVPADPATVSKATTAITDNCIIRADGTDGKSLQGSTATISDAGLLTATAMSTSDITAPTTSVSGLGLFLSAVGQKLYLTANAWVNVAGTIFSPLFQTTGANNCRMYDGGIYVEGSSSNLDLYINAKGTGKVYVNGIDVLAAASIQVRRGTTSVASGGTSVSFSPAFPGTPTIVGVCHSSGNTLSLTYVSSAGAGLICNHSCQGCSIAVSDYVSWIAIYS